MSSIAAIRLARICAYSTHAPEWEQFVHLVTPVMALAAWRVGQIWGDPSHATIEEILQESFVKLCQHDRRILREFEDRGNDSFLKLLRMVTASTATDYFRRTRAERRGGLHGAMPVPPPIEEEEWAGHSESEATRTMEWPVLMTQLDDLLRLSPGTVTPRDRNLFWLYYRNGMTAEAISQIPAMQLTAKGVESALQRMTRLLRETILNGKSKLELPQKSSFAQRKVKGFSPVIAIDSVERR